MGEPLLQIEALAPERLGAVSFTLHRGEIFGIAGLLGAGRTRLLRGLFGLDAVKSGFVKLGVHRGPAAPAEWWDSGMGMLSEDRTGEGLATSLGIADNMTMTRLEGPARGVFVSPARAGEEHQAVDRAPRHSCDKSHAGGVAPLGRQSAEGCACASASPRCGRAGARRADARHRRCEQGADLQADRPAGVCPSARKACSSSARTSPNSLRSAIASPSCRAAISVTRDRPPNGPSTRWCWKHREPACRVIARSAEVDEPLSGCRRARRARARRDPLRVAHRPAIFQCRQPRAHGAPDRHRVRCRPRV